MSDSKHSTGDQRFDYILAEYLCALEAGFEANDDDLIAWKQEFVGRLLEFIADRRSREAWENEGGALRAHSSIIE